MTRASQAPRETADDLSQRLVASLRDYLQRTAGERIGRYALETRVKSDAAIAAKLGRASRTRGERPFVNDLIGIRLLGLHVGVVPKLAELARAWARAEGLVERTHEDRLDHAAAGGYRAVHLDFEHRELQTREGVPGGIEIQITTYLLNAHGQLVHDLLYKGSPPVDADAVDRLERLGEDVLRLDRKVGELMRSPPRQAA